jgi:hypothetical protein
MKCVTRVFFAVLFLSIALLEPVLVHNPAVRMTPGTTKDAVKVGLTHLNAMSSLTVAAVLTFFTLASFFAGLKTAQ